MTAVNVFVVEDQQSLRTMLVDALAEAGFTSTGFADASQALAELDQSRPEVILLDMMMPGMNGFEFLARLRADPALARVPVLILSALGEELQHAIDARSSDALGIAGILAKPVDLTTLLGSVSNVVARAGNGGVPTDR
jgi:DNA-binding response OmpR family regulator